MIRAVALLARPVAWIPEVRRRQIGIALLSAGAIAFPLLHDNDADIDAAMSGNICRCGTYPRIRKAIHRAAEILKTEASKS